MSEKRDLQEDRVYVERWPNSHRCEIALHAIDRAIAAEKERDALREVIRLNVHLWERDGDEFPASILLLEGIKSLKEALQGDRNV